MSEQLPEGLGPIEQDPEQGESMGASARRAASVTLRREGGSEATSAQLMDPANQSLAEALRITFRILQLGMFAIFALFALSGFRSVREGEVGIRLLFGKVSGSELPPGFQPSAPYPFGDMIKVEREGRPISMSKEFWPFLKDDTREISIDRMPATNTLKPGADGSLVTGDSNIAHTRWQARFRRSSATSWAKNVSPEHEDRMIRAALARGIVHAVAQTPIERLLKQSSDDQGSVAAQAKDIAQAMLDDLESGLEIERLFLVDKTPPISVRPRFVAVESAASNAGKARDQAEGEASEILSQVAGEAAPVLSSLIDAYELAIEVGDEERQAELLSTIYAIFDGSPVDLEGLAPGTVLPISGSVTRVINDARLYVASEVNRRQTQFSLFQAKLEQYEKNPELMITSTWADAFAMFTDRPFVEQMFVPPGASGLQLLINADPEIRKEQDREAKRVNVEAANRGRMQQQQLDKYRSTESGVRPSTQ